MIKIAVCDDEVRFVSQIKELLTDYEKEIEEDLVICEFYDGIMLLDKYDCSYDIIFLDIKMPYMNGIKVAEKIRSLDPNVTIVFLTSLLEYAVDGYKVHAANYLIKPVNKKKLTKEIENLIEKSREEVRECLLVENADGQFRIPVSSIKYIETYNRNLLIHTEKREVVCYKKLKQMKKLLEDQGFAQSHKGYLVNLLYVDKICGNDIILVTKEVLPVTRVMKKEFMKNLARYLGEKI